MQRSIHILFLLFVFVSCGKDGKNKVEPKEEAVFLSAVDISSYPEIEKSNPVFYDLKGNQADFLDILRDNGVNTIRLRLWVNPEKEHSGFEEVEQFSQQLRTRGFQIWLTLHYSNTWADPGQQEIPKDWQGISYNDLKDSVYDYTEKVVSEIQPEYIQIGNEINSGLLHPMGHISTQYDQFIDLMKKGITAVRENSNKTKIILHYAGYETADWFYGQVKDLDYDIIGLSYYPIWHGKSLLDFQTKMRLLSEVHNKQIVIAETAYPFTLGWNDLTNNIVGKEEQLILPQYPATAEGQQQFIGQMRKMIGELDKGIGFCYWGAESIAWKGDQATIGSSWENQALFNFENKALPVLREFQVKEE